MDDLSTAAAQPEIGQITHPLVGLDVEKSAEKSSLSNVQTSIGSGHADRSDLDDENATVTERTHVFLQQTSRESNQRSDVSYDQQTSSTRSSVRRRVDQLKVEPSERQQTSRTNYNSILSQTRQETTISGR